MLKAETPSGRLSYLGDPNQFRKQDPDIQMTIYGWAGCSGLRYCIHNLFRSLQTDQRIRGVGQFLELRMLIGGSETTCQLHAGFRSIDYLIRLACQL